MRAIWAWASNSPAGERASRVVAWALSDRRYPLILALGVVVLCNKLVREFIHHDTAFLYLEYLANYDFGFLRRGLVPQILSYGPAPLTHLHVKLFALAMFGAALCAYLWMFARRFGFDRRELPLFACTIASPAVFKNFAHDFARLDILGFLGAVIALALPLNGAYVLALGALCCLLIVAHEAQIMTYVPVIGTIAMVRLLARPGGLHRVWPWREALALLAIVATAVVVLQFGNADVPPDVLLDHIRAKAVDPVIDRIFIWYADGWQMMQFANTPEQLWSQFRSLPRYLLILLAHVPLLTLAWRQVRDAPRAVRTALAIGLAAITIGSVVLCVVAHDRARFFATWLAGLILVVHAARLVPPQSDPGLATLRVTHAVAAAWLLAIISRVGLIVP